MPKCTEECIEYGRVGRRVVEANFQGADISSDGGLMLLKRVDERLGLTRRAAQLMGDGRDPARVRHELRHLLAQRVYGLCCGYEDLNDHQQLRDDLLMQTALGRADVLASSPTLCRLENSAGRAQSRALHKVLLEQFTDSMPSAPEELVLDSMLPTFPCTGRKRPESSTPTTTVAATCRCTCSVDRGCSPVTCGAAASMERRTPRR